MSISATSRSLAKEVIEGKWGNGAERIRRLTEAGYNATHIQDVVNEMYINGEVDANGNVIEYDEYGEVQEETKVTEGNIKEVEIDITGYDGLKITLVT